MLLYINEREHQLLVELLESALRELRDLETAHYGAVLAEREAIMVRLQQRLIDAQASGLLLGEPESRRIPA